MPGSKDIFTSFDSFVEQHNIDLDNGPVLGTSWSMVVHESAGFAVRRPRRGTPASNAFFIKQYVDNLVPGLGVPNLEQIKVVSTRRCRTISTVVPGRAALQATPADLHDITDDTIADMFTTLETMQEKGISLDGMGYDYAPSGNIMLGPRIGFVDFVRRPDQTLKEKLQIAARTILFVGNAACSKTFIPDTAYARPAVMRMADLSVARYGSQSPEADIVREVALCPGAQWLIR